jgi:acyl transferase domain-containing protein
VETDGSPSVGASAQLAGPVIIPLSAKAEEQLRQVAVDLLAYLQTPEIGVTRRGGALDLKRIAYTLQTGREHMEERLGLIASSLEELVQRLSGYLDGVPNLEGVYRGRARRQKGVGAKTNAAHGAPISTDELLRNRQFANVLEAWVTGADVDWEKLYRDERPGRVRLPVYPFAKERYWAEDTSVTKLRRRAAPPSNQTVSVEDVFDQLESGTMDEAQAVRLLRSVVG